MNEKHASVGTPARPKDGDVSMCITCGEFSVYDQTALGNLRKPTEEEAQEFAADERLQMIHQVWASAS